MTMAASSRHAGTPTKPAPAERRLPKPVASSGASSGPADPGKKDKPDRHPQSTTEPDPAPAPAAAEPEPTPQPEPSSQESGKPDKSERPDKEDPSDNGKEHPNGKK
jgi:hypothetical protein